MHALPLIKMDAISEACPPTPALPHGWMAPQAGWPADGPVHAVMSARDGGVSMAPYGLCNLGDHVQDRPEAVQANRDVLARMMQARPVWLSQVHGNRVLRLTWQHAGHPAAGDVFNPDLQAVQPQADGAYTTEAGLACTVMVADCLPVLLAAPDGRGVAALHAGWRGLAGAGDMSGQGIVHTGVPALCEAAGVDPGDLLAWLGPCIGPMHFEVGPDVLQGFGVDPASLQAHPRFVRRDRLLGDAQGTPRWLADLPGLARDTLAAVGVHQVHGGTWCTVSEASRFFSFRRDGVTGRQAASICLR